MITAEKVTIDKADTLWKILLTPSNLWCVLPIETTCYTSYPYGFQKPSVTYKISGYAQLLEKDIGLMKIQDIIKGSYVVRIKYDERKYRLLAGERCSLSLHDSFEYGDRHYVVYENLYDTFKSIRRFLIKKGLSLNRDIYKWRFQDLWFYYEGIPDA